MPSGLYDPPEADVWQSIRAESEARTAAVAAANPAPSPRARRDAVIDRLVDDPPPVCADAPIAERITAVLTAAGRLAAALDEQDAAAAAHPPMDRHQLPDVTQDEIDAIGRRQRAADAGALAALAEFRRVVRG